MHNILTPRMPPGGGPEILGEITLVAGSHVQTSTNTGYNPSFGVGSISPSALPPIAGSTILQFLFYSYPNSASNELHLIADNYTPNTGWDSIHIVGPGTDVIFKRTAATLTLLTSSRPRWAWKQPITNPFANGSTYKISVRGPE